MNTDNKLKILIVEDAYIDATILKSAFKGEYRVLSANNGMEALSILERNPDISIVLTDLFMPIMNGFELLKEVKSNPLLCNIPFVVVTSSDDVDNQIKAFDYGAYDVLIKPLNTTLVIHRVHNIMTALASNGVSVDTAEMYKQQISHEIIDEISGVYTKKTFIEETKKLLHSNPDKKYYLLRFDVDGFKLLNDVCGPDEGDRLLNWIGIECSNMAEPGVVYGRWEADHFVVCMDKECFSRQQIISLVSREFAFDNSLFSVSLRLGIYIIDNIEEDIRIMADRALVALRSIKGNYSFHHAFFSASMMNRLTREQDIASRCEKALDRNEFVVYLQPQYNYSTGELHGAEALVRWCQDGELISPGEFIPIFEKNGFITKLDKFVWNKVCELQRQWLDEGINIMPISVNVSRVDVGGSYLLNHFEELISFHNLPKNCLRLEITESAYMNDPSNLVKNVKQLQDAGFSVEMDDFGSGYSSLNTLKDVPVDMLKLDMKFLEKTDDVDFEQGDRSGSILSSVVRMSNWLKLPIIAEGVETKTQADYLKSIGCVYMQGYYFDRPMPVSEYELILKRKTYEHLEEKKLEDNQSNASQYLNSGSPATLMFNCFVGGAAITEYSDGFLEAIRINDRFYQTIGRVGADILHKRINLLEAFDEPYRVRLIDAIDTAICRKNDADCEVPLKSLNSDNEIWLKITVRMLACNSGKYLLYCAVDDITNVISLAEQNKELAMKMYSIINSAPCGIIDFMVERDCVVMTYFNDYVAEMTGFDRADFEEKFGGDPFGGIHPDDCRSFKMTAIGKLKNNEANFRTMFRVICSDGNYIKICFDAAITHHTHKGTFVTAVVYEVGSRDQVMN